mmetsp:Transcript_19012/g.41343  ORF Transcript_19012/g.41343 Transcript_19012/m.41343 type:complete len:235 (-) Transcript_19012:219-923(-)
MRPRPRSEVPRVKASPAASGDDWPLLSSCSGRLRSCCSTSQRLVSTPRRRSSLSRPCARSLASATALSSPRSTSPAPRSGRCSTSWCCWGRTGRRSTSAPPTALSATSPPSPQPWAHLPRRHTTTQPTSSSTQWGSIQSATSSVSRASNSSRRGGAVAIVPPCSRISVVTSPRPAPSSPPRFLRKDSSSSGPCSPAASVACRSTTRPPPFSTPRSSVCLLSSASPSPTTRLPRG